MLETLKNAFKIKEIRNKILFTFAMLVVIRLGSQLPVPGVDRHYFSNWFAQQTGDSSSSTLSWHWPTKGRIVEGFSVAEQGNKGIDISGQKGQPIYAASSGKVVYAGSALRGYGKLIILKHNDDYLSAYAHNDELRVKEGDTVKGGAVIANMGSTDAPDVRLHFEIRYKGKSINPMGYLPKR